MKKFSTLVLVAALVLAVGIVGISAVKAAPTYDVIEDGTGLSRTASFYYNDGVQDNISAAVDVPDTINGEVNASFEIVVTGHNATDFILNYSLNGTVVSATLSANGTYYANFTTGTVFNVGDLALAINVTLMTDAYVYIESWNGTCDAVSSTSYSMTNITEMIMSLLIVVVVVMVIMKAVGSISKTMGKKKE